MLTVAALLLHGYHLGVQDQAIYLPAIKLLLDPALYARDTQFFISQTQWMFADEIIALFVRTTGLSLPWVLFLFHLATLFAVLLACLRISRRCWTSPAGQWGALLMAAALLSLPAAGSRVPMLDNHVHPRNPAMAALLLVIPAALDRRRIALLGVAVAAVFHPLSAAIGAVHLALLAWKPQRFLPFLPLLTLPMFVPPAGDWQTVLRTCRNYYLWRWYWYEWLGVVVPLGFLLWFAWQRGAGETEVGRRLSGRLAISTVLFVAVSGTVSAVPQLEGFVILQLMRGLQISFLFFFFFLGGWLGDRYAGTRPFRWALLLLPACLGISYFQLYSYPATAHIEWPGRSTRNEWVAAFDWVRQNTPRDAYFALDPLYMERKGEDFHGFRGLAERSHIVDYIKDRGVTSLTPGIATEWIRQWRAVEQWRSFTTDDFARLRREYGVTWALLETDSGLALDCPWQNARVRVCRIP
jgi:hypothetical protein